MHGQYSNTRIDFSSSSAYDFATNIIQENNNSYLIGGACGNKINPTLRATWLARLDSNGIIVDTLRISDSISEYTFGYPGALSLLDNGMIAMSGYRTYYSPSTYYQAFLIIIDTDFNIVHKFEFGDQTPNHDTVYYFSGHSQTPDGGFVLVGLKYCSTVGYGCIIKIDSSGSKVWERNYGPGYSVFTHLLSVQMMGDSTYIVGGSKYNPAYIQSIDPVVLSIGRDGQLNWQYVAYGQFADSYASIQVIDDTTINICFAYGKAMSGINDAYKVIKLMELDNLGQVRWMREYATATYNREVLSFTVRRNGNILLAGYTANPYPHRLGYLLETTSDGDSIWYREYEYLSGTHSRNYLWGVIEDAENNIIAIGEVRPQPPDTGSQDSWIVRLDSIGCLYQYCDTVITSSGHMNEGISPLIYPNPTSKTARINLTTFYPPGDLIDIAVFNSVGLLARKFKKRNTGEPMEIDLYDLSAGLYIVKVSDESGKSYHTKLLLRASSK